MALFSPSIKFGAHLSIVGGYEKALVSIRQKGGNCLQIFSSSPRDWKSPMVTQEKINLFRSEKKRLHIDPIYFHASYLLNMADGGRIGAASKKILIDELTLADQLGISGSVIHLGSYKNGDKTEGFNFLINNIEYVLKKSPRSTFFIIENAGTRKIGETLDEIAAIVQTIKDDRVKVCLDTCHLHATGYNLCSEDLLENFLSDFDKKIGLSKLELFHINDSRDLFHSNRDRHENIGEGQVGISVFENLVNHPKLNNIPFIIETPGFDKKGPDKKNLDILKSLVE